MLFLSCVSTISPQLWRGCRISADSASFAKPIDRRCRPQKKGWRCSRLRAPDVPRWHLNMLRCTSQRGTQVSFFDLGHGLCVGVLRFTMSDIFHRHGAFRATSPIYRHAASQLPRKAADALLNPCRRTDASALLGGRTRSERAHLERLFLARAQAGRHQEGRQDAILRACQASPPRRASNHANEQAGASCVQIGIRVLL